MTIDAMFNNNFCNDTAAKFSILI